MAIGEEMSAPQPPELPAKISRSRSEPLYIQVLKELRRLVSDGTWSPGERILSERDLSTALGVSRITVRHAIELAIEEGLLQQSWGVGTFVAATIPVQQDLAEVRTFEQTLTDQGLAPSTQIVSSSVIPMDIAIARTLHLGASDAVYNLKLLGLGNSTPVVYYDSYFPLQLGLNIAEAAERFTAQGRPFSTLDLHGGEPGGRTPTEVVQTIEASTARGAPALSLGLTEGDPILTIESLMMDDMGPLEFRRAYYRPERYRFVVRRRLGSVIPSH